MKIAKEYRWEMGHRLPNHPGLCKNVHGHSYRMVVELEGEVNENGMVIDFYELGKIVKPIVEMFDHSFLVYKGDSKLISMLEELESRKVIVDYYATVENICKDMLQRIIKGIREEAISNVSKVTVTLFETPNASATLMMEV
ncbi:MAG: 6-pyruvoyl trahydropterin synthase family protein [Ignavibacteria bacterium]